MVGPALQGASLMGRFGIPLLQQAGIALGIQGLSALGNAASQQAPVRSGPRGQGRGLRFRPSGTGLANLGEEYKEEERLAGAAAEAFRPGAGFPGQQQFPGAPVTPAAPVDPLSRLSPQDRAYQQERARVEAMVKSNPDMQKEEIAAARAKVRDQGMAIWAAKNKDLAKQVKPGQSGYEVIQQTLYPGGTPVPTLSSESEAMLNVIAPANQQGVRPNVTPMPGQLPSFGSATEGMFNAITDGGSLVTPIAQELLEKYKEQLLKQVK